MNALSRHIHARVEPMPTREGELTEEAGWLGNESSAPERHGRWAV